MNARSRLAVLVTTSVLAAGGLAGCDDSDDQSPASGPTKHHDQATDQGAEPTAGGGDTGDSGDDSGSGDTTTVPVYFVGDTPQGPRLYREFRRVDAADPLAGALNLAASGEALDPDYRTLLPDATFTDAGSSDEHAEVPLPDDSWTRLPQGMDETEALLAVQQIVYTVQGVLQERIPVDFTDSAGGSTQIFGIASEDAFSAADPIRTLALMSVTSPETGQTVSGDTLDASGVGSSFEANVVWEIRDAGGDVVLHGSTTADGWMDKLYPWAAHVDVSALGSGAYTFVASTDDPSGEGAGPTVDSKAFTIG